MTAVAEKNGDSIPDQNKNRKENAMPRKEKLEDMIAKLDKLNAKIDKNDSEMKPIRDSRDALKKCVDAEMERIKIERYTQIAEASLEMFGWDITAKDFKDRLSQLLTDPRNKGFAEKLKFDQAEREKAKVQAVEENKNNATNSSAAVKNKVEALPASADKFP